MNNVLIIGSGGREHALAWKFSLSPSVDKIYVAPGNPGMESVAETANIPPDDFKALADFAKSKEITLTVVGPELPLVKGIVDYFHKEGLRAFGPRANAAIIEGSKSYAKMLMAEYGIPTAKYRAFSDYTQARDYLETQNPPFVLKADGLAQGKGVVIAQSKEEAHRALSDMMQNRRFGDAGQTVVIEEFLTGIEFTYMAFVNGENVYPMEISKDHKRAFDDDQGPNTGGMGAYSPVPQISEDTVARAHKEILLPTARAMVQEGRPFVGVLYAGLIATEGGPKVIEFNARFGDPETEVVLPRLENDIFTVMTDILSGKDPEIKWSQSGVIGIVLASKGYPGKYDSGYLIEGLENLKQDTLLFHCGTEKKKGGFVTSGGRVLLAARHAATLAEARTEIYKEIGQIKCGNLFFRKDI